jgi:predicted Zn-dependent protease
MSRLLVWYLLSSLTGSPVLSLLALVAFWWGADRFTFRLLPDPVRWTARWRRRGALQRTLAANPHDRRARLELAQLLVEAGRARQAIEVLTPNVEAGDDDVHTAFTLGAALARSGFHEQAERALASARASDPHFRLGEIDLELGELRLASGDREGAREALARLVAERPGTVQGRWLLSRALAGLGDPAGARRLRDEAWREYVALPRFHRRFERKWAWRARPTRPLAYAAIALAVGLVVSSIAGPAILAHPAPAPQAVDR